MTALISREQTQTELHRLLTASKIGAAEALIRESLAKDPGWQDAWIELVKLQVGTGRAAEGFKTLRSAIRQNHHSTQFWCFLGVLETNDNRHSEGYVAFEKALVTDPASAFSLMNLASPLPLENEVVSREKLFSWMLTAHPLATQARLELAKSALARHASHAVVEERIKGALVLAPGSAESHYIQGVLLYRELNQVGAIAAHRRALVLAPGNPAALYQLARSAFLIGDIGTALPAVEAALEFGYSEIDTRFLLARVLRLAERFDESDTELRRVEKIDPSYAVFARMVEWTVTQDDFQR
jgi:tetratricopeptide (TPR) repeat protein